MTTHVRAGAPSVFTKQEAAAIPEVVIEHQYESEEEDPQEQHETLSNLRSLESIYQRLAPEIVRKVPSTKDHQSWRKISEAQACALQWDALCDALRIPEIMVGWHQVVDKYRWKTATERLFPNVERYNEKTKNGKHYMQNLSQCSWFQDYEDILKDTTISEADKNVITAQARKKLREAEWLPMTRGDRMWGDGLDGAVLHGVRIGPKVPAIVLNPRPRGKGHPSADIPGGRLVEDNE